MASQGAWREAYHWDLVSGLTECWQHGTFVDLRVSVGDRTFFCHRNVLSALSPLLHRLIMEATGSNDDVITVDDVTPLAFEHALTFLYGKEEAVTLANAREMLSCATRLQIKVLKRKAAETLARTLDSRNCAELWQLARVHGSRYLGRKARRLLLRTFETFRFSPEFKALPVEDAVTLLTSDSLEVSSEESVLQAVQTWLRHDKARMTDADKLWVHVRFPILRPHTLRASVVGSRFVRASRACRACLQEGIDYHLQPAARHTFSSPRAKPRKCFKEEGLLVVVGGRVTRRGSDTYTSNFDFHAYSPATGRWCGIQHEHTLGRWSAVCPFGSGLYLSGGRHSEHQLVWINLLKSQPSPYRCEDMAMGRFRHALVAVEGSLYAVGGRHVEGGVLRGVERYDTDTDDWTPGGRLAIAVYDHVAVATDAWILVAGGCDDQHVFQPIFQCFSPRTKTCSLVRTGGRAVDIFGTPPLLPAMCVCDDVIYLMTSFGHLYKGKVTLKGGTGNEPIRSSSESLVSLRSGGKGHDPDRNKANATKDDCLGHVARLQGLDLHGQKACGGQRRSELVRGGASFPNLRSSCGESTRGRRSDLDILGDLSEGHTGASSSDMGEVTPETQGVPGKAGEVTPDGGAEVTPGQSNEGEKLSLMKNIALLEDEAFMQGEEPVVGVELTLNRELADFQQREHAGLAQVCGQLYLVGGITAQSSGPCQELLKIDPSGGDAELLTSSIPVNRIMGAFYARVSQNLLPE